MIRYFTQWKWGIGLQWLFVNALAWMAAFGALSKITDFIERWLSQFTTTLSPQLLMIPGVLVFGIVLGFFQSLWLRKKFDIPGGWTRATAFAYLLILALPASLHPAVYSILSGVLIGGAQWLVLRKTFPAQSWWILLSGGSWIAGKFFPQRVLQHYIRYAHPVIYEGLHGIVYGFLTGFGIMVLFQYANSPRGKLQLQNTTPPRTAIFVASWVIMNVIGWGIGFGSIGQSLRDSVLAGTGLPSHFLIEKAALECVAALFVWFVLWRQWFRGSFWWVIWSGVGAAAGISLWTFSGIENATGIILYGTIVGFFQWFILSQQMRGFLLWMGTRTIAWAGSLVVVSKIGQRFTPDIGWGVGGLMYGTITGALLFWKFRQKAVNSEQ